MRVLRKAFKQELSSKVAAFVNSIDADKHLIAADIKGSLAHAQMLAQVGLISSTELDEIEEGLKALHNEFDSGKLELKVEFEDVHMNVEKQLEAKIGTAAARLHTGRSRNDQVALDTRLYCVEMIEQTGLQLLSVQEKLLAIGLNNSEALLPGYTHLQRAQAISFAHAMHAFEQMFARDYERLEDCLKRTKISPLGAAAFAGSSLPIDPQLSAELLGFDGVFKNSIDAVSDRDFAVEFLSAACICSTHLSQLAETFVIWSSSEFGFIGFEDNVTTASSLMPNKKNPDPVELIRGKTGSVIGDLVNVLVTLKALPLGYNRDLQEIKPAIIHSADTLLHSLEVLEIVIDSIILHKHKMLEAAGDPFLAATDLAEYLVKKGVPFRQAHEAVSELVTHARLKQTTPEKLSLQEFKNFAAEFEFDVFDLFDPALSIANKSSKGSTGSTLAKVALGAALADIQAKKGPR